VITDNLSRYERQCLQLRDIYECSFCEFEGGEIGGWSKLKFSDMPIIHYPKNIL